MIKIKIIVLTLPSEDVAEVGWKRLCKLSVRLFFVLPLGYHWTCDRSFTLHSRVRNTGTYVLHRLQARASPWIVQILERMRTNTLKKVDQNHDHNTYTWTHSLVDLAGHQCLFLHQLHRGPPGVTRMSQRFSGSNMLRTSVWSERHHSTIAMMATKFKKLFYLDRFDGLLAAFWRLALAFLPALPTIWNRSWGFFSIVRGTKTI